ncbi:hypothetical protein C8R43DRAFT_1000529 [Mycena crocata]|nr:hypothetical protein C8R43DRAFT_1000529 [Mycena crocata]
MDPELMSVLQSNLAPSDSQATVLRTLLHNEETEISQMQDTIAVLLTRVSELRSQSARKEEALPLLWGALSPLRHIPNEVLGHIFSCCVDNIRQHYEGTIMDLSEAPWVLGRVCSRWRAVSLGLPQLWDTVGLSSATVLTADSEAATRTLLARSRALPLYLAVRCPHEPKDMPKFTTEDEDCNIAFFELVWEPHHRIKAITLDLTDTQVRHLMRRIFTGARSYPLLSSFYLAVDDHSYSAPEGRLDITGILDSLQHSPLLQEVELSWSHPPARPITLSTAPWSGLRNLRLQLHIQLPEARDILMQCPALESARFSLLCDGRQSAPWVPRSCILHNLRELYLAVPYADIRSGPLFDTFTCPRLETISLDVKYLSVESFRRFATRSDFKLLHLSLERVSDITAYDLRVFLRLQQTLRTLSVTNCDCCAYGAFFELFLHDAVVPDDCVALPELKNLVLGLDYTHRMVGDRVAQMAKYLSAHREPDSPFPILERVVLMTHSSAEGARFYEDTEDRLAAVVASGFILREVSPATYDITAYAEGDHRRR